MERNGVEWVTERTLSCISGDLKCSIPVFAAIASPRVIILTNAWRLSTLTMHVWTWPNAEKIARKSSSEDLVWCQYLLRKSNR